MLTRALFAFPILFFGLLLAGRRVAAGDRLVRRAGSADWSEQFTLAVERAGWFSSTGARRLFETLKQKLFATTDRIDVPASVNATLRAGLAPVIENQFREDSSSYVILVDKRGDADHAELLAKSLVEEFHAAKIRFTRYDFRGRPAFCTRALSQPTSAEPAFSFAVIAKRHAGERLLLISDGENLLERSGWRLLRNRERLFVRPGTVVPEMKFLRDFGAAVLLTPTPRAAWGPRERMLQDFGLLVEVADPSGIARIGRYIASNGEELNDQWAMSNSEDRFLARLSTESLRYGSDIPLPPEEIANLVTDLQIWMARTVPDDAVRPGRGFLILCGIAAFPVITPGLTLVIATLLSRDPLRKQHAPVDAGIFAPLARLPWLRYGRMPDWLRIAVLNSLGQEEFKRIRALQQAVLGTAVPASGQIDPAAMERIATGFEVAVARSASELDEAAATIGTGNPGEEVERIFLSVLHGERLDPVRDVISPEAPEAIRERLAQPERRRRLRWTAAAVTVAVAFGIGEPVLAGWIAAMSSAGDRLTAPIRAAVETAGLDTRVWWLDLISIVGAAACLSVWLVEVLRPGVAIVVRRRLLPLMRVSAVIPVISAAASVTASHDPTLMPFLFAASAAIFLLVAPATRTQGAPFTDKILAERLANDDWIATSLGGIFASLVFLGPVFLVALPVFAPETQNFLVRKIPPSIGLTLQLAAVFLGATTWGLGSRFVRYNLLGPIVGRPTANEQWLDFVAPLMSLLFIASASQVFQEMGVSTESFIIPSDREFAIWFVSAALLGCCFMFLTLRLWLNSRPLLRFIIMWTFGVASFPIYWSFILTILPRTGENVVIIFSFVMMMWYSLAALTRTLAINTFLVRAVGVSLYGTVWVWIVVSLISRYLEPFVPTYASAAVLLFSGLFMPAAAVFWPNLRFILMTGRSLDSFGRLNGSLLQEKYIDLARGAFAKLMASPWWFAPALWALTLQYKIHGVDIDLSVLAVPVALFAGWRCGNAAEMPILVGSLPFVAQLSLLSGMLTIATPGGFWPVTILLFLVRIITNDDLRLRILGRNRASRWDLAFLSLSLAAAFPKLAISGEMALSIDPSWLAIAVGFSSGASRMRWREPAAALVAGMALTAIFHTPAWAFVPWALAAASFLGGRLWRSFFLPGGDVDSDIGRSLVIIGLLGAAGLFLAALFVHPQIFGSFNGILLLSLVAGIITRHSPRLSVSTWVVILLSLVATAALDDQWVESIMLGLCVIGLGLLGYQLHGRGGETYARALGLIPASPPHSATDSRTQRLAA
jgi:hypothetical protein